MEEKKKVKKKSSTKELEEKIKSLEEEVLRAKADLINYRKRKDEEVAGLLKYANADFINSILPILDNFDRAMPKDDSKLSDEVKNFLKGFELTRKTFVEILEANGVKEIECLGKEFDASFCNCVYTESDPNIKDDTITEVFTKGYTYYDKVLRYASVKVNKIENEDKKEKEIDKNE